MNKIYCPVCGSDDLKKEASKEVERVVFGPIFNYEKVIYTCNSCGEKGDFAQVNDAKFLEARKHSIDTSIKSVIETLSEENEISMAYFERAFELPMRTLTRWKGGDYSATAIALLRVVKTYPWITEVAAHKFEQHFSQKTLLNQAASTLATYLNDAHVNANTQVIRDSSSLRLIADLTPETSSPPQKSSFISNCDQPAIGG